MDLRGGLCSVGSLGTVPNFTLGTVPNLAASLSGASLAARHARHRSSPSAHATAQRAHGELTLCQEYSIGGLKAHGERKSPVSRGPEALLEWPSVVSHGRAPRA